MSDVINFRRERAEREEDARLWTPADALADTLERIASGEIKPSKLLIIYSEPVDENDEEAGRTISHVCAGVTRSDHLVMLELNKTKLIEAWRE